MASSNQSNPPLRLGPGVGCPLFFPSPRLPRRLCRSLGRRNSGSNSNLGTSWGPFSLSQSSPGRMTNWDASLDLKSGFSLLSCSVRPTCCHGGGFPSLFLLINSHSSHATGKTDTHTHTHSVTRSHTGTRERGAVLGVLRFQFPQSWRNMANDPGQGRHCADVRCSPLFCSRTTSCSADIVHITRAYYVTIERRQGFSHLRLNVRPLMLTRKRLN
jgi:hypothetical protein